MTVDIKKWLEVQDSQQYDEGRLAGLGVQPEKHNKYHHESTFHLDEIEPHEMGEAIDAHFEGAKKDILRFCAKWYEGRDSITLK